ncbi:hypothetical protein V5O48_009982 [Marasmius crinis-equi]|uniref:Uncharacterized protein n=1 Tax=Marasmius crinis-equi TaxID=585013 RepID=A0ABR3F9R7_9AGAR
MECRFAKVKAILTPSRAAPRGRTDIKETVLHIGRSEHPMADDMLAIRLATEEPATTIHDQRQSPLFSTIPPELRLIIFQNALLAFYDKSRPFPPDAYYYRPDFLYHDKIDTTLLLTCRQIYLETYLLPISLNDHVFWCERGPYPDVPHFFFDRLLPQQISSIGRVHLFTQLWWLENGDFERLAGSPNFRPRSLHITVRHTDWWWWEENNPLALDRGWTQFLKDIEGLEELILEMETIDRDKDQIYAIAEDIGKTMKLCGERNLECSGALVKAQWMGPSSYRDDDWTFTFDKEAGSWIESTTPDEDELVPHQAPMLYQRVKLRWDTTRQ